MTSSQPTILATSGGYKPGRRVRFEFDRLVHHAVDLSGATGRKPRVTNVGTATRSGWNHGCWERVTGDRAA